MSRVEILTQKGKRCTVVIPWSPYSFRSLIGFINDDNLQGLQSFLESKQVQVDDRDEVGCVKPTSATYEKGQTEVRRQIRSNRICIEGSGKIRPAHSPPVFLNGTDN
ncbi:hypothetical protein NQ318_009429 [Aromia moschata]|uniref:Uncharacterized protein n=1 Tax=Aromia moschata TaxID=1265417 RepID=A0AAV8Z828_9CUCU|nr:hypothetical protein NQ318_009429 [Aromia moschata]